MRITKVASNRRPRRVPHRSPPTVFWTTLVSLAAIAAALLTKVA